MSALDLGLRAQVLDLLATERARRNMALLFVTHDLAAARHLCERMLVMHRGEVVEQGPTARVFTQPSAPYTRSLLAAALTIDPRRAREQRHARATASRSVLPR